MTDNRDPPRAANVRGSEPLEWTVSKSLLDAQSRTNQAFEHYLLYALCREQGHDAETLDRILSQAIRDHERIIEDLEEARSQIETR